MIVKSLKFVIVLLLAVVALWNLSKIPGYFEYAPMTDVTYNATMCEVRAPPFTCSGMQAQWNLHVLFGSVSPYKLRSDVALFLAPHCAMGVALEVLLILALVQGTTGLYERSKVFLPIAGIFAVHILPAASGIPDSLVGAPVNEVLVGLIILGIFAALKGMYEDYEANGRQPRAHQRAGPTLVRAWVAIGLLINTAPIGEWTMMLSSDSGMATGVDRPHPESGRDFYAKLKCPWIGKIATVGVLFTVVMYGFEVYAATRGEEWRSPFSRKGPALWQLFRHPAPKTNVILPMRPEVFLEATGECFVLCMGVAWFVTSLFNPGVYTDNILRSIVGYNNLCVGFDTPPARYVAMPLLVMQATLAWRYSYLDTIRLRGTKSELSTGQYLFGFIANWIFAVHMMCFPMLLVITADFSSWQTTKIHLYLFMLTLVVMWLMIAGNVYEAPDLRLDTKIWFGLFTAHTVLLPVVGVVDVLNFHPDLPAEAIATIRYEKPNPPVPWPITAYLDYGWFFLLMLTVVFLPDAPPVRTVFRCSLEDTNTSFESQGLYTSTESAETSESKPFSSEESSDVIGKPSGSMCEA